MKQSFIGHNWNTHNRRICSGDSVLCYSLSFPVYKHDLSLAEELLARSWIYEPVRAENQNARLIYCSVSCEKAERCKSRGLFVCLFSGIFSLWKTCERTSTEFGRQSRSHKSEPRSGIAAHCSTPGIGFLWSVFSISANTPLNINSKQWRNIRRCISKANISESRNLCSHVYGKSPFS